MQELVFIIHIFSVVSLICLVLVQHGKGADMGAAFGSGASNTMFGSVGSISFFAKLTGVIAIIFFVTSITLGVMISKQAKQMATSSAIPVVAVEKASTYLPLSQ
ncbi:MAG: preprotein translocase subunit SecG [Coxiellaceae bacterium]|jgi:preprotein translocase subunit SecG|nr:preprotein translocase subunit SecG [Coxiellaceae bacterium]